MAGAVYAISESSLSEFEYSISAREAMPFLQASQRPFTSSASAGSGGFLRAPSLGKPMGRHSLALSQLISSLRCSSLMSSQTWASGGR